MSTKKVVFLMGSGHNGSTLLGLILGSHSRIHSLGELVVLRKAADTPFPDVPKLCSTCAGKCEFWNSKVDLAVLQKYFSQKDLFSALRASANHRGRSIYEYFFEWSDRDILVDFSKPPKWIELQLRQLDCWKKVRPILIYLARDGRAVVNSYLRKYPDRTIVEETVRWKRNVEDMEKLYRKCGLEKKLVLSYEELATRPADVGRRLCEVLEVEYEPAMLRYWEHEHHIAFGNAGTRSLVLRYQSYLNRGREVEFADSFRNIKERHGEHYEELGLDIKLDLRWKTELTEKQLEVFEFIAGETNKPLAYDR